MRKIREVLRLTARAGTVPPGGGPSLRASAWGRSTAICGGRRNAGSAGRCRPTWTTRCSKPGCSPAPPRCGTGSGPTVRTSTGSCKRDGVTLQLLWEEYLRGPSRRLPLHPVLRGSTGSGLRRLRPSMRQVHRAGEKTFIDFSGKRPSPGRPAVRGSCGGSSCSSPCSGRAASPTPRRPRPSSCPTGSARTCPHGRVLRGRDRPVGPRPAQERHHPPLPLRARRQPHLRGPRRRTTAPSSCPARPRKPQGQGRRGEQRTPGRSAGYSPGSVTRPSSSSAL